MAAKSTAPTEQADPSRNGGEPVGYVVDARGAQAILAYLAGRPFAEVVDLIPHLTNARPWSP